MEERKPKGTYDKVIIACLTDDPVFQIVNTDWTTPDGKNLQQVLGFKPTKRLEDVLRNMPVEINWFGGEKTWRVFARVEKGFPDFRLNSILRELNNKIAKFDVDDRVKALKQLVHDFYEKVVTDFDYSRRNPVTDSFEFKPWQGMALRSNKQASQLAMTEDSEPDPERPTSVGIRKSQPRNAKKSALAAISEEMQRQEPQAASATHPEPSGTEPTAPAETEAAIAATSCEAAMSSQDVIDGALMPPPMTETEENSPDEFDRMIEKRSSLATIGSTASSNNSSGSNTPGILDSAFVGGQTSSMNISSANATLMDISRVAAVRESEDPNFTFLGVQDGPAQVEGEVVSEVLVDVAQSSQFVTKTDLREALDDFFARLMAALTAENKEVRREISGLKTKVENKFNGLKRTKKQVKDTYEIVSDMSIKQDQLPKTPTKSAGGNAVLQGKGKSLLFRCLPFNKCGKGCDIFFGSPFVRDQVTELIAPYFANVSVPTLHAVISRTCIFTCFTPLARAHMIFGENKNSRKMLKFNKRPLPEGFFTLTKKCIVPRITYQLNLQPGMALPNISDIAETCAGTFNTERNNFLTHAVKRTMSNDEAARAIVECDFEFREWNKHTHPLNMVIPTYEEHMLATKKRAELKAGLKDELAGTLNQNMTMPEFQDIFKELSYKCSMEIEDPKTMIKLILVAGHLNGEDFKTMTWDRMEFVPEFPQLHAQVLHEIGDDITPLVQAFNADAVNYLPDIVMAVDESKPGKRRSPVKKVTYPSGSTAKAKEAAKKAILQEEDILSDDDSDTSSGTDDEDSGPSMSKRARTTEPPTASSSTTVPPEVPTLLLSESSESG